MSDTGITVLVAGLLQLATMIVGFLTLWIKLKYGAEQAEKAKLKAEMVERKIDENTSITKSGTEAAAKSANAAAVTAVKAKSAADAIAQDLKTKLNGGVDLAIESNIKPIRDALQDHIMRYESDMKSVQLSLKEISGRMR